MAEVAAQRVTEPASVLREERLVEVQLMADAHDLRRIRLGATGERHCGVAGDQEDEREDAERDQQQEWNQRQQPPGDEASHAIDLSLSVRPPVPELLLLDVHALQVGAAVTNRRLRRS